MRKTLALAAIAWLSVAGSVQAAPRGIVSVGGVLTTPEGLPLYTYVNDTMKGMSHCRDDCAKLWAPFKAPADASTDGPWSVITREDGSRQWAYHDKPLYTYSKDKSGQAGEGESVATFKLAHR